MTALLILAGMVILVCLLIRAFFSYTTRDATFTILVILMGGLVFAAYLNFDDFVALWAGITTWCAAAWAYSVASWKAFFGGMTTAWSWMGFGLIVAIGTTISLAVLWPLAKRLARIEVSRAKAQTAAAERQAEEERQKRIDAEQRADAAEKRTRQAEADKAEAQRCSQGLSGQLAEAVSLADRRGKQLREGREKKRAEKGERPVQQIEKAVEPTNGQDKKPPDTPKRKKPGKGRSPKRLPSRLPRR